MPNVGEMFPSKWLTKEDVGKGKLVRIKGVKLDKVFDPKTNGEVEKWCMFFQGEEKGMVLNVTNAQLCAQIFESEDTDEWKGKPIVLFNDMNVHAFGKQGGIRVRAPKQGAKLPEPVPEDDLEGVPFDDEPNF